MKFGGNAVQFPYAASMALIAAFNNGSFVIAQAVFESNPPA